MRSSSPIRKDKNPNGKLNCQKTKEKKLGSVRGKAGLRGLIEVKRREKGKGGRGRKGRKWKRKGKGKEGKEEANQWRVLNSLALPVLNFPNVLT